jgi:hypothetical protein
VLHKAYNIWSRSRPFFLCFLQAACDETSEKAERVFLQLLLSSTNGDSNEVFSCYKSCVIVKLLVLILETLHEIRLHKC